MSSSRADNQDSSARNFERKKDSKEFRNDRGSDNSRIHDRNNGRDNNRSFEKDNRNSRNNHREERNNDRDHRNTRGGDRASDKPRRFDSKFSKNSKFKNSRFDRDGKSSGSRFDRKPKFDKKSKFGGNQFKKEGKKDNQAIVQPHSKFQNIFTMRSRGADALLTKSLVPGVAVYGEKLVTTQQGEFRVWSPHRSKLAAGIHQNLDYIHIAPGNSILYLGAASGTSVSHVSDIVGASGVVYAVEFSQRSARDLVSLARRRPNIVPIVCDARHPWKYRMVVSHVDTIFSDVAQPDQARIVALNASYFLKDGGNVLISIKANCVDCTRPPAAVYASEVDRLRRDHIKPKEQVDLDPFEKDHAMVVGVYKPKSGATEQK